MPRYSNVLVVSVILMLAGCATVPGQEMADARTELRAAEAANAARYAPAQLAAARRHLAEAESRLELGDYAQARRNAERARMDAISARIQAQQAQRNAGQHDGSAPRH